MTKKEIPVISISSDEDDDFILNKSFKKKILDPSPSSRPRLKASQEYSPNLKKDLDEINEISRYLNAPCNINIVLKSPPAKLSQENNRTKKNRGFANSKSLTSPKHGKSLGPSNDIRQYFISNSLPNLDSGEMEVFSSPEKKKKMCKMKDQPQARINQEADLASNLTKLNLTAHSSDDEYTLPPPIKKLILSPDKENSKVRIDGMCKVICEKREIYKTKSAYDIYNQNAKKIICTKVNSPHHNRETPEFFNQFSKYSLLKPSKLDFNENSLDSLPDIFTLETGKTKQESTQTSNIFKSVKANTIKLEESVPKFCYKSSPVSIRPKCKKSSRKTDGIGQYSISNSLPNIDTGEIEVYCKLQNEKKMCKVKDEFESTSIQQSELEVNLSKMNLTNYISNNEHVLPPFKKKLIEGSFSSCENRKLDILRSNYTNQNSLVDAEEYTYTKFNSLQHYTPGDIQLLSRQSTIYHNENSLDSLPDIFTLETGKTKQESTQTSNIFKTVKANTIKLEESVPKFCYKSFPKCKKSSRKTDGIGQYFISNSLPNIDTGEIEVYCILQNEKKMCKVKDEFESTSIQQSELEVNLSKMNLTNYVSNNEHVLPPFKKKLIEGSFSSCENRKLDILRSNYTNQNSLVDAEEYTCTKFNSLQHYTPGDIQLLSKQSTIYHNENSLKTWLPESTKMKEESLKTTNILKTEMKVNTKLGESTYSVPNISVSSLNFAKPNCEFPKLKYDIDTKISLDLNVKSGISEISETSPVLPKMKFDNNYVLLKSKPHAESCFDWLQEINWDNSDSITKMKNHPNHEFSKLKHETDRKETMLEIQLKPEIPHISETTVALLPNNSVSLKSPPCIDWLPDIYFESSVSTTIIKECNRDSTTKTFPDPNLDVSLVNNNSLVSVHDATLLKTEMFCTKYNLNLGPIYSDLCEGTIIIDESIPDTDNKLVNFFKNLKIVTEDSIKNPDTELIFKNALNLIKGLVIPTFFIKFLIFCLENGSELLAEDILDVLIDSLKILPPKSIEKKIDLWSLTYNSLSQLMKSFSNNDSLKTQSVCLLKYCISILAVNVQKRGVVRGQNILKGSFSSEFFGSGNARILDIARWYGDIVSKISNRNLSVWAKEEGLLLESLETLIKIALITSSEYISLNKVLAQELANFYKKQINIDSKKEFISTLCNLRLIRYFLCAQILEQKFHFKYDNSTVFLFNFEKLINQQFMKIGSGSTEFALEHLMLMAQLIVDYYFSFKVQLQYPVFNRSATNNSSKFTDLDFISLLTMKDFIVYLEMPGNFDVIAPEVASHHICYSAFASLKTLMFDYINYKNVK